MTTLQPLASADISPGAAPLALTTSDRILHLARTLKKAVTVQGAPLLVTGPRVEYSRFRSAGGFDGLNAQDLAQFVHQVLQSECDIAEDSLPSDACILDIAHSLKNSDGTKAFILQKYTSGYLFTSSTDNAHVVIDDLVQLVHAVQRHIAKNKQLPQHEEALEAVLPHDVHIGSDVFRKGEKLSTFIEAARSWHQAACSGAAIVDGESVRESNTQNIAATLYKAE